jgi:CAAX protease family protein
LLRNPRELAWHRRCIAFLALAYGFAWILEFLARISGVGELTTIGVFGPAFAGLVLSRRPRQHVGARPRAWLPAGIVFLAVCWAVGYFSLPQSLRARFGISLVIVSGLFALVPAWILGATNSRDTGVREFLRTLLRPRSWLWTVLAAVSFAAFLVLPNHLPPAWRGSIGHPRLPAGPLAMVLFVALTFAHTFIYGGGVGEEPGWRGYLLPALQERLSPLIASLILWFFWALWHLPLDLQGYAGNDLATYLDNRVVKLLPLTVISTWLYNRSRGSILPSAVFHVSFNTFPQFLPSASGTVWILWLWAAAVVGSDRMWRAGR